MICPECKEDRNERDFYGKELCYKCIYQYKIKNRIHDKKCRECGKKVPEPRWIYCSTECGVLGNDKLKKQNWVKRL